MGNYNRRWNIRGITDTIGVFSSTNLLGLYTEPNRVKGAIETGSDFVTSNTHSGWSGEDLSTDISEDFKWGTGNQNLILTLFIPEGAEYLFLAAYDDGYHDNTSNGYSIDIKAISSVPVPTAIYFMGTALFGLIGFFRRH